MPTDDLAQNWATDSCLAACHQGTPALPPSAPARHTTCTTLSRKVFVVEVTALTWAVAVTGLQLMSLLGGPQLIAVLRPRDAWTVSNVYGGQPDSTDPKAYFAFNQGYASD